MSKIDLFRYSNYRIFLKDKYDELKALSSSFSYRYFSMKCGYSSPNFLQLVIKGKRNLSSESIEKFASFFKFTATEKKYFAMLVDYNQEKDSKKKESKAKEILKSSVVKRIRPLARDQFEYYANWYVVAIRELIATKKIKLDAKNISELLSPKVKVKDVERSLELLLRLGLIKRKDNRFVQGEELVSTGDEVSSASIAGFHREMLKLAGESIDRVEREFRDISSVTIGVSPENINEIKLMIQKFRKDIMALSESDQNKQVVYQIGMQMFPLSKVDAKTDTKADE